MFLFVVRNEYVNYGHILYCSNRSTKNFPPSYIGTDARRQTRLTSDGLPSGAVAKTSLAAQNNTLYMRAQGQTLSKMI